MCHMKHVTCHLSHVTCHIFFGQSVRIFILFWNCMALRDSRTDTNLKRLHDSSLKKNIYIRRLRYFIFLFFYLIFLLFKFFFRKNHSTSKKKNQATNNFYRFYYPHRSRELVSPVSRIFCRQKGFGLKKIVLFWRPVHHTALHSNIHYSTGIYCTLNLFHCISVLCTTPSQCSVLLHLSAVH